MRFVSLVVCALALTAAPAFSQTICNGNQCWNAVNVKWISADEFVEAGKTYVRGDDNVFREKVEPPKINPPAEAVYHGPMPTGVLKEKCAREETYSINGRKVGKASVVQALVGDKQSPDSLVDDSAEMVVSVFAATNDDAKRIEAELRGKLGDAGFRFWHGTPADWSGKPVGFVTTGRPTIYAQAPSGKVLHRQDDYDGGAEAAVGAIRKAKAEYDPAKDVDRRRNDLPAGPAGSFNWLAALVLGAFVLYFSKKPTPAAG